MRMVIWLISLRHKKEEFGMKLGDCGGLLVVLYVKMPGHVVLGGVTISSHACRPRVQLRLFCNWELADMK